MSTTVMPPAPDLIDKKIGEKILLPPVHCSSEHPPNGHLPFLVVASNTGDKDSKTIGTICEYCKNRKPVPNGLGPNAFNLGMKMDEVDMATAVL